MNEARNQLIDRALADAKKALEAARSNHGVMLMSYPAQDAWMARDVDGQIRRALASIAKASAPSASASLDGYQMDAAQVGALAPGLPE